VARQTRRLLAEHNALKEVENANQATLMLQTTGNVQDLQSAAARWLKLDIRVDAVEIN
jgi:hypothetical protein